MEHFVVSARKYRPQSFKDVVGQQAITNTLQNAIENNHLAQALLFCGPRGVGKTTCARILAKNINQTASEANEEDFAFNIFELDAASNNSVDDIRSLIDQVRIPPQVGKYKVYIIDEVHMLSQAAFNAFLKTLEEPPKHAIFILATTEKHKIIPTILSRCQIFDFKRIRIKDAKEYLKAIAVNQGIEAEEDALHIIAQKADGAMRDALSIFDRIVSFTGKKLTRKAVTENLNVLDYEVFIEITELLLNNDIPELLIHFNDILSKGFDGHHFIAGLASHFRDLMVSKDQRTVDLLEVGENTKQKYISQSQKTLLPFLIKAIELANECDLNYKSSKNQRLLVELCLMQLASINFDREKKNDQAFIIPASFYKTQQIADKDPVKANTNSVAAVPSEIKVIEKVSDRHTHINKSVNDTQQSEEIKKPIAKPVLAKDTVKKVSGLSLSSIQLKKQHESAKKDINKDKTELPKDAFTLEDLQKHWDAYIEKVDREGRKILASNLASDAPKLKDDQKTVWIALPNDTMKKEVEHEEYPLMQFLKEKLNNFELELLIVINETAEKKYAFTPQEKYEKLKEKNPLIDTLRREFDLDL